MVHRTKEGCGDVSDNGVDEALQGFVLIRKIEREMDTKVSAGHEQFNSTQLAGIIGIERVYPLVVRVFS